MADLNEGRHDLPRSRGRFIAFSVAASLLFTLLGGRLFQMQVLNGTLYADRAAAARIVDEPIKAPRGLIFDREGRPVAVNVPSWVVDAVPADLPGDDAARSAVLSRVAIVTGTPIDTLRLRLDAYHGSPYDQVPLVRGITRDAALLLSERAADLPGIVVGVDAVREYLDEKGQVDGSLLAHILGYTGPISQAQLQALADAGYLPDDTHRQGRRGGVIRERAARHLRIPAGRAGRHRASGEGRGQRNAAGTWHQPDAHHRRAPAANGDRRPDLGDAGGGRQAGCHHRHEPADR